MRFLLKKIHKIADILKEKTQRFPNAYKCKLCMIVYRSGGACLRPYYQYVMYLNGRLQLRHYSYKLTKVDT